MPDEPRERFEPRAAQAMARMFDDVSGRYDLLNRLMTLGQDGAWRAAMTREVPEDARVVLDLCTGSGVSLQGLVRPGRLVVGADVSLRMLERAADELPAGGWGPRLVCADAFRLPLRDRSIDVVTVAFGMRNLRPQAEALAEIRRVLRPGGVLAVLEATAPDRGPVGALHGFHLRHVVPLLGRLSSDPSAYRYLSASIFEFGTGPEFERALAAAGFERVRARRFLLGATHLWATRAPGDRSSLASPTDPDQIPASSGRPVHNAREGAEGIGHLAHGRPSWEGEWRVWNAGQAVISAALSAALVWGLVEFAKWSDRLPLESWQRLGLWLLLGVGTLVFTARTVLLLLRLVGPPHRR